MFQQRLNKLNIVHNTNERSLYFSNARGRELTSQLTLKQTLTSVGSPVVNITECVIRTKQARLSN